MTVPIVLESAAMPMMPLLLLVLVLVAIGVLVLRTSRRSFVDDLAPGEIVFISLSIGLYFASWLLITLAEIGRLRLGWVLGLTIIFCAMVIIVTLIRQKPFGASPFFAATSRSWLTLLPFAIAIAILPFYRPFEYILGGRDPGVYVNAGIMMSKMGGVPFHDLLFSEIPPSVQGLFSGVVSIHGSLTTERLQGFHFLGTPFHNVVPQGMHLFPAWLAVAKWLFGYPGLLWITPFFGLIGMLGVYHFTLRFGGTPAAIIATALFILSPIQIYFSRYPSSEILMLAFLWSSLYFFQLFQARSSRLCAALSGAGLGLALLAHIDSLLLLAPVCLLVAYYLLALPGERNVRYFGGAFLLFLIQTAGHLWFIARPYVLSIINALKIVPFLAEIALPGFFILLLLLYLFRHRIRQLLSDGAFNRLLSAAWPFLVGVAAWFAYFYRPTHPQGSWDLGNANSFLYFAYYLGGVATVVFVSALMYFGYGQKSRNILLTLMIATFFGFYFYRLQIYPELIWAMRRFLPVIWPASFILIGLFLWRLWQIGEGVRRVASRSLACCALALIGWHSTTTSRTYFKLNEFQGAVQGVDRCAKRFNKNDLLIFEPRFNGSLQTLSLPLWSVYGDNVLQMVFDNISQARIDSFFDQWRSTKGGRIFVIIQRGVEVATLRYHPRFVCEETIWMPELEQLYKGFPKKVTQIGLPYKVYELIPGPPDQSRELTDIGGAGDDLLVSYFFAPESFGTQTFRWSTYKGGVFLPAFNDKVTHIDINMMAGPRPDFLGRPSCIFWLNGIRIGIIWPALNWATYRLAVPDAIRAVARAGATVSLSFKVAPFSPINYIPGNQDARLLGVAVDYVKLIE